MILPRPYGPVLGAAFLPVALAGATPAADESRPPMPVRLELSAGGEPVRGQLVAIDGETVQVRVDGGAARSWPVTAIRRVVRETAGAQPRPAVVVTTRDGGTLGGDDFTHTAAAGVISHASGRIEVPAERIARVAWLAAEERSPAWLDRIPAEPAADLVVIRGTDGPTFVECAVTGVDESAVTVVLDGDTIPVKRAKVAGIVWLREPVAEPLGPVVTFTDGRLVARQVRWTPETFVIDDVVRLPPAAFGSIDYAVGRTLPLAEIEPEAVDVEPAFGSLAGVEGLAAFFAPRSVPAADGQGPPAMVLRPRTVATWRVPTDARRFRARLSRDVVETAPATVDAVVELDGREVARHRLGGIAEAAGGSAGPGPEPSGGPAAVDIDVSAGRRLTLTVDFVGTDLGCPVRIVDAVFEK